MGQSFDPYYKWLGIPPEDQPPSHYRLLGVREFEPDPDVLQAAADQRMAHLRTYQTSRHSQWSQRLLNEVAAAKICLLNPAKRLAYDEQLREAAATSDGPVAIISLDEPGLRHSSVLHRKRRFPAGAVIGGVMAIGALAVAGWAYWSIGPRESPMVVAKPNHRPVDHGTAGAVIARQPAFKAGPKPIATDTPAQPVAPRSVGTTANADFAQENPFRARISPRSDPALRRPEPSRRDVSVRPLWEPPRLPPRSPEQTELKSPPSTRVDEPAVADQDEAIKNLRERYKDELAKARTADEKQALAMRLVAEAQAQPSPDAGVFARLWLARELSTQTAGSEAAFAAIDAMSVRYKIDALDMKADVLAACAKKTRTPPQRLAVAEQAERLRDAATAAGNSTQAANLTKLAAAQRAAAGPRPRLPVRFGKWFPLLASPDDLFGWETGDCQFRYADRIIDLRAGEMYCPLIVKDATIRASVRCRDASCIRLIVRNSDEGCYIAQLAGNSCVIIKATRRPPGASRAPAWMRHWGQEDVLNRIAVPGNYGGMVFAMGFAAAGDTLTVFFNGQPLLRATDSVFTEGMVGIGTERSTGLLVTNVELLMPKGSLVADERPPPGVPKSPRP